MSEFDEKQLHSSPEDAMNVPEPQEIQPAADESKDDALVVQDEATLEQVEGVANAGEAESESVAASDEAADDLDESLDREADEIMASLSSMLYGGNSSPEGSSQDAAEITPDEAAADAAAANEDADEDPFERTMLQPLPEVEGSDGVVESVGSWGASSAYATPEEERLLSQLAEEPILSKQSVAVQTPVPGKKKKGCSIVAVLLLTLLVLLIGAYIAGVVGFMHYFMPNTTLNGENVSLKSVEEVATENSDSIDSFSLSVTGDGLDLALGASDINAKYNGTAYAHEAISQQNAWLWPAEVLGAHTLTAQTTLSYDAARLDDVVGSAVDAFNKDAKQPKDAEVTFNEKTKRYEVKPEEMGTVIDRGAVLELTRAAIDNGEQMVELTDDQLVKPEVYADDKAVTEPVEKVNACLGATQDLTKGDEVLYTVSEEEINKWLTVSDDLTVTFDEEACTKWCRGELSEKLDTIGSTRTFKTPDGRELTVSGGTYGWSINGADVATKIAENVTAGKQGSIELEWLAQGNKWNPGGNEWGDTYVEIDLGAQHVKYFKDGNVVWETDCVSGGPNIDDKDRRTPNGVYYVNDNMRSGNIELKGEIDPKTNKPRYISYVKYWMPFIGDSVALHDADWRSSFGGDIYLTNGSHGCVNLPPDKAAELYGMVGIGTVVVVHG